jgi:site-specific DNA-methyltransferase (adenine-specific)
MHSLHLGDCLEILPTIASGSIDAVITDPPYGTTACKWDSVIPLGPMWAELKRVVKPKGAIVLFASQPFTSVLIGSNLDMFRYVWVWDKKNSSSFLLANKQPLRRHEDICVFSKETGVYNPIMRKGVYRKKGGAKQSELHNAHKPATAWNDLYFPTSILEFSNADKASKVHPTQKGTRIVHIRQPSRLT